MFLAIQHLADRNRSRPDFQVYDPPLAPLAHTKAEPREQILAQGFHGNVIRLNARSGVQAPVSAEPEITTGQRDRLRMGMTV